MTNRRGVARSWLAALALASTLAAGPAAALTMTTDDPVGLDESYACLTTAPSCAGAKQFDLVAPGAAGGMLTFTPTSGSFGTMDILLWLPSFSLQRVAGAGAVEEIVFTSVTVSITGWSAFNTGTTIINTAAGTGSVSGTWEQLDGSSMTVVGPTAFSDPTVTFGNLICPSTGVGLCGFQLGQFGNFVLSVDGTDHEFVATFDLAVPAPEPVIPEPATGGLLALGLALLAARRRNR